MWSVVLLSDISYHAFHYPVSGYLPCCYVVPEPSVRMRSEGYGSCPVCQCVPVCIREIWHNRHQAGILAIPTASARQARENVYVASAKSTAFDLEKPPGRKTRCVTQPTNYRCPCMRIISTRELYVIG